MRLSKTILSPKEKWPFPVLNDGKPVVIKKQVKKKLPKLPDALM